MKTQPKTRTSAERHNRRMEKIWDTARRLESERIAKGEPPNPNLTPVATPTPGPWTVVPGQGSDGAFYIKAGDRTITALDSDSSLIDEENARLIAASPQLLKALTSIANLYPYPDFCAQKADEVYGINDGKARGILLQAALDIARNAILPCHAGQK